MDTVELILAEFEIKLLEKLKFVIWKSDSRKEAVELIESEIDKLYFYLNRDK